MYSDQPTIPSSVVIFRNELTRQPASQCKSSILTIFIFELPQGRGEHRSSWAWTQQPHHAADRGWRKAALDGLPLNAYLTGQFDQSKLTMADENRRGFGEG